MDFHKYSTTMEVSRFDINGINLLSIEEYEKFKDNIPPCNDIIWWLRSPGNNSESVAYVYYNKYVCSHGYNTLSNYAVRPALRYSNHENLQIMDKINLFGYDWTIISNNIALCDQSIGKQPFRKDYADDANNYESSDIKKFIENWLKDEMDRLDKHGCWIQMSDKQGIYYTCSECGMDLPRYVISDDRDCLYPYLESIDETDYCPHCGARMTDQAKEV